MGFFDTLISIISCGFVTPGQPTVVVARVPPPQQDDCILQVDTSINNTDDIEENVEITAPKVPTEEEPPKEVTVEDLVSPGSETVAISFSTSNISIVLDRQSVVSLTLPLCRWPRRCSNSNI